MELLLFTVFIKILAGNLPLGQKRKDFGGESFGGGKLWWGITLVGAQDLAVSTHQSYSV